LRLAVLVLLPAALVTGAILAYAVADLLERAYEGLFDRCPGPPDGREAA